MGDCALCHAEDLPGGEHPDLLSCASCHQPPSEAGQGSDTWRAVRIDHSSPQFADCQSCHVVDAPANHFTSQCSSCHTPPDVGSGGSLVERPHGPPGCPVSPIASPATVNHVRQTTLLGSVASVTPHLPAGVAPNFNHQGAPDCQGCHNPPRNHYGDECKQCHSPGKPGIRPTLSWHKFDMDHGGANGNCSTCHTRNGTNCTSCHESEEGDDDDGGDGDDDD